MQPYALSSNDAALLDGQPEQDFSIAYFGNHADAENFVNQLPDNYNLTAGSVTIYANIKQLIGGCSAIVPITLVAFEKPTGIVPNDLTACDGWVRDGRAMFDLRDQAEDILATQAEGCTVKFYISHADAESQHNPIAAAYTNEIADQMIYARITNSGGCYKIVAFRLIVGKCVNTEDYDIFPKFFTPNGDGYNDTWQIKSDLGTPSYKIEIFDRYGRLIKVITDSDNLWNGTYAGRDLPSDDYWFILSGENLHEHRGHFSLKR
jgi:gliding motility-associated-like protein